MALASLKRDVPHFGDHVLMDLLAEYLVLRHDARSSSDLRLEQEADIMFNVCRKELDKRGCTVSEFGNV